MLFLRFKTTEPFLNLGVPMTDAEVWIDSKVTVAVGGKKRYGFLYFDSIPGFLKMLFSVHELNNTNTTLREKIEFLQNELELLEMENNGLKATQTRTANADTWQPKINND
jgi:FtsZ-binding cell division protein ZapB